MKETSVNSSSMSSTALRLSNNQDVTSRSPGEGSLSYDYNGGKNTKGKRHGYGSAVFGNGDEYRGEYHNGIRCGYGEYTYVRRYAGAKYTGMYADNKKNGYGIFIYPDTSRYEGDWKNNKRHGQGCYYFANGDVYKGEWADDKRHGFGEYCYTTDGMKYRGMWSCGNRSGEGKLMFSENYYEGQFLHDEMLGPGTFFFSNGIQQHGEYVQVPITYHDENPPTLKRQPSVKQRCPTEWRCKSIKLTKGAKWTY